MSPSDLPIDQILHGKSEDILKDWPDNCIDAVVTDPPAAIGFMASSKDHWDQDKGGRGPWVAWLASIFSEVQRVMKPGAHALVWALPRTAHWTATALEDAGFQVRDSFFHVLPRDPMVEAFLDSLTQEQVDLLSRLGPSHPMFLHLFSGMPKSQRIKQAINKVCPGQGDPWEGWGTAVKPAVEVWFLVRKPIQESCLRNQVLATGTGALNIDGCRVSQSGASPSRNRRTTAQRTGHTPTRSMTSQESWAIGRVVNRTTPEVYQEARPGEDLGRFPSHLLLSHSPGCRPIGSETVPGRVLNRHTDGPKPFGDARGADYSSTETEPETVVQWDCEPGCPVRLLDEQTGPLTSGSGTVTQNLRSDRAVYGSYGTQERQLHGDCGGASRFYQQVDPLPLFLYSPKITQEDKHHGAPEGSLNVHPTVKSQPLSRYLVRLITPPNGIVLDPFAGSGSIPMAAVAEGFRTIGIEQDDKYVAIARSRLAAVLEEERPRQRQALGLLDILGCWDDE